MARYEKGREQIFLLRKNGDLCDPRMKTHVMVRNPDRRRKMAKIEMPLGEYADLMVQVALIRHPNWGKYEQPTITDSRAAVDIVRSLESLAQETVLVLLLNNKSKVVGVHMAALGGMTSAAIDPKTVFQAALAAAAAAMIIVHNHPSGDPQPSTEDKTLTRTLQRAATLLDIRLLDHIVVGRDGWVSFADRGLL